MATRASRITAYICPGCNRYLDGTVFKPPAEEYCDQCLAEMGEEVDEFYEEEDEEADEEDDADEVDLDDEDDDAIEYEDDDESEE